MKNEILVTIAIVVSVFGNAQTPTTDPVNSANEVVAAEAVEWDT